MDGVVIKSFDCFMNEWAITGNTNEMKKEDLTVCKQAMVEKDAQCKDNNSRDLPSPIVL